MRVALKLAAWTLEFPKCVRRALFCGYGAQILGPTFLVFEAARTSVDTWLVLRADEWRCVAYPYAAAVKWILSQVSGPTLCA